MKATLALIAILAAAVTSCTTTTTTVTSPDGTVTYTKTTAVDQASVEAASAAVTTAGQVIAEK